MPEQTIDFQKLFQRLPYNLLILSPKFDLLAATDAYFAITHTSPAILNRNVFDVFPESPATKERDGVKSLKFSLQEVISTKEPHTMPSLRYDIQLAGQKSGEFATRWWRITNTPILDEKGQVIYIVNAVEEISNLMDKLQSAHDAHSERNAKPESA